MNVKLPLVQAIQEVLSTSLSSHHENHDQQEKRVFEKQVSEPHKGNLIDEVA